MCKQAVVACFKALSCPESG